MKYKLLLFSPILFTSVATNAFGQWTRMNFKDGAVPFAAIGENTASPIIFAGNINGIYRSTDNGISWMLASSQLANLQVDALAEIGDNTSSSILFAGTFGNGIFCSTDSGASWNPANTGLPKNAMIYDIALTGSETSPLIFVSTAYGGAKGIFLSTDNGTHWNAVNSGLTTLSIGPLVSGSSNASMPLLFASGTATGSGIFLTTNNGADWTSINNGRPAASVFSIAVLDSGTPSPIVFTGTWGAGVVCSSNAGVSWESSNNGLTDLTIYSLATYGTNIFAGTDSGIFLSSDSGALWRNVNQGLTQNNSFEYLAAIGSTLFAESDSVVDVFGDDTAFAWRRSISEMIGQDAVVMPQIAPDELRIYPNPTTDLLHIESSASDIVITDLIGRTRMHSVSGTHDLDVSGLPQGVYFITDGTSRAQFVKE